VTEQNQQADGEIHEDQLLNFLVSALTGAFGVSLAENADIDPDDIYEVLVGATADGTLRRMYIRMVTRAAWNTLSIRRLIPANRPPDDRFVR